MARDTQIPNDRAGFLRKAEKLIPPFKVKLMLQVQGPFSFSLDPLSSLSVEAVYRRKMRQSNGSHDETGRVTGHRGAENSESGRLCPRLVLPPRAVWDRLQADKAPAAMRWPLVILGAGAQRLMWPGHVLSGWWLCGPMCAVAHALCTQREMCNHEVHAHVCCRPVACTH